MTVQGFNSEEFGKSLTQQAMEVVPVDFDDANKKFVVNTVYKFCVLAGDALINDPNVNLNAEQVSIICQFIGEWTFHKSIDVIRSGIPVEHWEQILQKIAFVVFEAAKYAQVNNLDQNQCVEYVENEVKQAYVGIVNELVNVAHLEVSAEAILSHSNIDEFANQQASNINMTKEEEDKELKLASLALFLRVLPFEKANKIIQALNHDDKQKINVYMSMQDLDQRVDPGIVATYLKNFNDFIPGVKDKSLRKSVLSRLTVLLSTLPPNIVDRIIVNERPNIKNFINLYRSDKIDKERFSQLSTEIVGVINDYIASKAGN